MSWAARIAVFALIAIIALSALTATVRGESDDPYAALQIPDFIRADLALLSRELELDDDQEIVLEALYMDYEKAFREGAVVVQKYLEDPLTVRRRWNEQVSAITRELRADRARRMEETKDPAERRKIEETFWTELRDLRDEMPSLDPPDPGQERSEPIDLDAWIKERETLRSDLLDNLQSLLTDAQRTQWPDLERLIRRSKGMRFGRLSGESLNLFHVVARIGLPPSARDSLNDVLDAYARELDLALSARDEILADRRAVAIRRAVPAKRASVEVDRRRAVRDVNLRYAEVIGARLPADVAAAFQDEVNRTAFPRIYEGGRGLGLLHAAAELGNLDETTRKKLRKMLVAYESRLAATNGELRETVLHHELGQLRFELEQGPYYATRRAKDPSSIAIDTAVQERAALDAEAIAGLETLLTPEQMQMLPRHQ